MVEVLDMTKVRLPRRAPAADLSTIIHLQREGPLAPQSRSPRGMPAWGASGSPAPVQSVPDPNFRGGSFVREVPTSPILLRGRLARGGTLQMRRGTGADPGGDGAELELERRLVLVTPADCVRGMFFRSVLEVMWALGDGAAVERCIEVCGMRKFANFTCYPASSFLRLLGTAARLLENGYGDFPGAMRALGRR